MCMLATRQESLPHIGFTSACLGGGDCADAAAGVESPTHDGGGIVIPQDGAMPVLAPSCHLQSAIQ